MSKHRSKQHRSRKWPVCISLFTFVMTSLILYLAYMMLSLCFQVKQRKYPVHGIDVSHHQHSIDWAKLQRASLSFAYIKATEGATYQDELFVQNWNEARANHILPGAYHFFTFCRSGRDQAINYLFTLSQVNRRYPSLPPVVDIELQGNCPLTLSTEQLHQELMDFMQQVKNATGCQPVIYTNETFYELYLSSRFAHYPLWIRSLHQPPDVRLKNQWIFWQYTQQSRIDGISTPVDQNVFYGTRQQFKQIQCHYSASNTPKSSP